MSKYIDAEKLITIIEERKAQQDQWINRYHDPINQGISHELTEILSIIESLQQEQPEVDLEKEIKRFLSNATKMNKGEWRGKYPISDIGFRAVTRRFYELGLNARKED